MPERPQAWSPSDIGAVVSGVQLDAMIEQPSGHRLPVISAGHRPLHPTGHPSWKGRGQGTDERHGRHSDISIATTMKIASRDAEAPPLGQRCGLATKIGSAMATLPVQP
jgi:hypothetical protein